MIDVAKALAELDAISGDIVALPKTQMADLLRELAGCQPKESGLALFGVPPQSGEAP